jgi:hypothetical protein
MRQMKRDWSAAQANWDEWSNSNAWAAAGAQSGADRGSVLGTLNFNSTGTYSITFGTEALAVVQSWVTTPSTNFGLIFEGGSSDADFIFDSNEASTVANRPRLIITYAP